MDGRKRASSPPNGFLKINLWMFLAPPPSLFGGGRRTDDEEAISAVRPPTRTYSAISTGTRAHSPMGELRGGALVRRVDGPASLVSYTTLPCNAYI